MEAVTSASTKVRSNRQHRGDLGSEQIRQLRIGLDMTQEEFAHEVGVTFATVNRWENNRTTPNKVAQKILALLEKKLRKLRSHT